MRVTARTVLQKRKTLYLTNRHPSFHAPSASRAFMASFISSRLGNRPDSRLENTNSPSILTSNLPSSPTTNLKLSTCRSHAPSSPLASRALPRPSTPTLHRIRSLCSASLPSGTHASRFNRLTPQPLPKAKHTISHPESPVIPRLREESRTGPRTCTLLYEAHFSN